MTIKCKKCTLFMQQTDRPDKFTRLEAHPCVGVSADPGFFTGLHVSHELFNLGYVWVCRVCGGVLKPGPEATPQALQRQCKTRTKPTQAIQASRPLAHQARERLRFGSPQESKQVCKSKAKPKPLLPGQTLLSFGPAKSHGVAPAAQTAKAQKPPNGELKPKQLLRRLLCRGLRPLRTDPGRLILLWAQDVVNAWMKCRALGSPSPCFRAPRTLIVRSLLAPGLRVREAGGPPYPGRGLPCRTRLARRRWRWC